MLDKIAVFKMNFIRIKASPCCMLTTLFQTCLMFVLLSEVNEEFRDLAKTYPKYVQDSLRIEKRLIFVVVVVIVIC